MLWEILFVLGLTFGVLAIALRPGPGQKIAVHPAIASMRNDVGWSFERYRIESLRMQWAEMDPAAREWYKNRFGIPKWARRSQYDLIDEPDS